MFYCEDCGQPPPQNRVVLKCDLALEPPCGDYTEVHLCKECGGELDDGGVCWECDIDLEPPRGESGKNLL